MAIPSGRGPPCVVHRASRTARASRRARQDWTDTAVSVATIPEMDARRARDRYGSRTTMAPHAAPSSATPAARGTTLHHVREALSARPFVVDSAIALFLAALSLLANFGGPTAGQPTAVGLALLLLES